MERVQGNTAVDITFTLKAQKILDGMKVCMRDQKKRGESLQEGRSETKWKGSGDEVPSPSWITGEGLKAGAAWRGPREGWSQTGRSQSGAQPGSDLDTC